MLEFNEIFGIISFAIGALCFVAIKIKARAYDELDEWIDERVDEILETEPLENALLYHDPKEFEKPKTKVKFPHNCVNCGAVLNGNVCEYCGTKY